jgi:methylenetetrahydrofolate reductase (NADPH)
MSTTEQVTSADLAALVGAASVEISSRVHQIAELRDHFKPGVDISITFLPGDNYRHNIDTAAALRRAGFNPVPHLAAREIASRQALDDFLARARGEADVDRLLLIAGDVAAAKGPFKSSCDVAATGLIEEHGFGRISVAGHPEGHPYLDAGHAMAVLAAWDRWGRETTIDVDAVTQFCFESAPILNWMGEVRAAGIELPVIVGLAGPASPATLMKFALRCGIGNSIRAVRGQIGRYGRLLTDTGPDEVVRGLQVTPGNSIAPIRGFHIFPFGGLRKAGNWLRSYSQEVLQSRRPASDIGYPNP